MKTVIILNQQQQLQKSVHCEKQTKYLITPFRYVVRHKLSWGIIKVVCCFSVYVPGHLKKHFSMRSLNSKEWMTANPTYGGYY